MVGMPKEMMPIHSPVEDPERASTGELISRLTRETTALVKAEALRLKAQAAEVVAPGITASALVMLAATTFVVGLFGFFVALFVGTWSLTGSAVVGGLVVGAVAWVIALIAAGAGAAIFRAIRAKLKV